MKILRINLSLFALLVFAGQIFSQKIPFWTENFTGKFPTGWTTDDPSVNNCLWTWCSDPQKGDNEAGCPEIWNTPSNQQKAFAATTATTGFMTMDSDDCGELTVTNHLSELTSVPINCAGKNEVWLQFQTHIGVYGHTADDLAVLRVSTDQTNWTVFQVFDSLVSSIRWSDNPEIPIINISSVAANQATVYLQWRWDGNYDYHWSVDDLELYDSDPTPANDLAISQFFYPVSSYSTPESQIATDTFAFSANISNKGLEAQTNATLKVWVENELGFLLFADSVLIPTIEIGTEDEEFVMPNIYVPKLVKGRYRINYKLYNSGADGRPNDNFFSSEFLVTDFQFAKEEKPEQGYRPGAAEITDPWFVGNYYRVSAGNLEQYKATSAEFAFTTDPAEIAINAVTATIYLLKANADIDDNLTNLDDAAFLDSWEWVGLADYEAPDTLTDNRSIQTVEILDFAGGTKGVVLEPGGKYFLAIGYGGDNINVFHLFNNDVNYYFTSTLIYTDTWSTFGSDANAVMRMNLSLVTKTDDKPLQENVFKVYPNPANDNINLITDFKYPTNATITIADINGRVISIQDKTGLTQEKITISTVSMTSGSYLARIATKDGTKTIKFVVNH